MKIKKLREDAIIPTLGTGFAAGYDLYACLDVASIDIPAHSTLMIDTGWAMEIPINFFGAIFARSGLASKQGLRPANCVGVIDPDYRGPVKVALHNDTNEIQTVVQGERIAQLVFLPRTIVEGFEVVSELNDTNRGAGGFGSTGK